MYTILRIIYGIPVDENIQELIEDFLEEKNIDDYTAEKEYGYNFLYHGSIRQRPAYIGIQLKKIDLIEPYYSIEKFSKVKVSEDIKKEIQYFIDKYPPEIQNKLKKEGIFIMNSSS